MGIRSGLFLSGYLVMVSAVMLGLKMQSYSGDPAGKGMARGFAAIVAYGLVLPVFCGLYTAVGLSAFKASLGWPLLSRAAEFVTGIAVACMLITAGLYFALPFGSGFPRYLETFFMFQISASLSLLLCTVALLMAVPKGVEHHFVRSILLHVISIAASGVTLVYKG